MAEGNSSPGMSSEGSGDRDSEWPPLESGNSSGSPGSAEAQPQQGNMSGSSDSADSNSSPGMSSEGPGDRDSEWPPLESGNSSGSPGSAEAQPEQGNMSGSSDSAEAQPQQSNNRGARNRPKQKWEPLPVDINFNGQGENRRRNLPPRMMNKGFNRPSGNRHFNNHQNNGRVPNSGGPFIQQVPPIPPPVAPYGPTCPRCWRSSAHPNPDCSFDHSTIVSPPAHGEVPNSDIRVTPSPTNLPPTSWRPPRPLFQLKDGSDHRKLQIKRQVEFYFDPNHLMWDSFLRQNMDSEGFVPIKLIATFRRIFQQTKDIDFIKESLQLSEILEVVGENVRSKLVPPSWAIPNGGILNPAGLSAYPPGAQFAAFPPGLFLQQPFFLQENYVCPNYVPDNSNNMSFYGNSAVFGARPPVVHPYRILANPNPFGVPPPPLNFPVYPFPANNSEPGPEPEVMPDPEEPLE